MDTRRERRGDGEDVSGGTGWKSEEHGPRGIGWSDGGVGWATPEHVAEVEEKYGKTIDELADEAERGYDVRKIGHGDQGSREVPALLEADRGDDPGEQRDAGASGAGLDVPPGLQDEVAGRPEFYGGPLIEHVLGSSEAYGYPFVADPDRSVRVDAERVFRPATVTSPDGVVWRSNGDGTYTRDDSSVGADRLIRGFGVGIRADELTGPSPVHAAYHAAGDDYYAAVHPSDLPHYAEEGTGQEGPNQEGRKLVATQAELDNWYTYHAPTATQIDVYTAIRAKAKELAELFNEYAPACADSTAAHRDLRDAVMAMNLAIACNPIVPWIPSPEELEVIREDLKGAIAEPYDPDRE